MSQQGTIIVEIVHQNGIWATTRQYRPNGTLFEVLTGETTAGKSGAPAALAADVNRLDANVGYLEARQHYPPAQPGTYGTSLARLIPEDRTLEITWLWEGRNGM